MYFIDKLTFDFTFVLRPIVCKVFRGTSVAEYMYMYIMIVVIIACAGR